MAIIKTAGMRTVKYAIRGTAPLLCHGTRGMATASSGTKRGGKKIPTPEEEAELSVYPGPSGSFLIPVAAFKGAMISAAKAVKATYKPGGQGRAVYVHTSFGTCVMYDANHEMVPIWDANGKPPGKWKLATKYDIDTRRARVQSAGVMRSRAKFKSWGAIIELEHDAEIVPVEFLDEFLALAGERIGVGDFRPFVEGSSNKVGGPFGRFTAERIAS